MNELAYALWTEYTRSGGESFMANRTGLGSTTLYYLAAWQANGERTQTRTFKNNANLFTYLANWQLYTLENGFQGAIKRKGS